MLHFGARRGAVCSSTGIAGGSTVVDGNFRSVGEILCYSLARMQTDDTQKKAAPVRGGKKSDGWREREEAKTAGLTPRKLDEKRQGYSLVRC